MVFKTHGSVREFVGQFISSPSVFFRDGFSTHFLDDPRDKFDLPGRPSLHRTISRYVFSYRSSIDIHASKVSLVSRTSTRP